MNACMAVFSRCCVQCLTHTNVFVAYLQTGAHTRVCSRNCTTCAFAKLIKVSRASDTKALRPLMITDRLKEIGKRFRVGRQEDAHEFLRLLLDSFQKAELRLLGLKETDARQKVEATFVHNVFGGYFRNQLK